MNWSVSFTFVLRPTSQTTKLALVKTCRDWNRFATPLLYEHITLSTVQQCELLLQNLTCKTYSQTSGIAGASSGHDYLSRFVSRLDLYWSDQERALELTVRLCSFLPELHALVVSLVLRNGDEPSTLFNALPPHVHHLFWLRNGSGSIRDPEIPLSSFLSLLSDNPELASISIPFEIKLPHDIQVPPNFRCPSVQTFVFWHATQVAAMSLLPKNAFPSLHFVNANYSFSETPSSPLLEFLSTHATKLSALGFNAGGDHRKSSPYGQLLRHLTSDGPPIAELHVQLPNPTDFVWFQYVPGRPACVTTIGVHLAPPLRGGLRECREAINMHMAVALPWTKFFPNLRTIRVMEAVDLDFYGCHNRITQDQLASPARWARNPIHVEDINGRALADFSSGLSALLGVSSRPVTCSCIPPRKDVSIVR